MEGKTVCEPITAIRQSALTQRSEDVFDRRKTTKPFHGQARNQEPRFRSYRDLTEVRESREGEWFGVRGRDG